MMTVPEIVLVHFVHPPVFKDADQEDGYEGVHPALISWKCKRSNRLLFAEMDRVIVNRLNL